jgi:DNA-binding FadR family transcriptional regulator
VLRWLLERKFSLGLLAEFTQMRLAIEPMAAALAAHNHTPETLALMQHAIARMVAAARGEDDPLASDIAFHVAVLKASANRFYAQVEELIETALRISIRLTNQFKGVALADVSDHQKVLDAIEAREPERARAAMEAIIHEVMDLIATAGRKSKSLGAQHRAVTATRKSA